MAFLETPRLSEKISFGATGGPVFDTEVVQVRSGFEKRNTDRAQAIHRYEIGLTVRKKPDFDLIRNHFMAVRGKLDGFRFKDFADFQITTATGRPIPLQDTTQVGTAGLGYGTPSYQLAKLYTAGANTYLRDITKLVAGTLIVRRGGVAVVAGAGAGEYTVSSIGRISMGADQSQAISSHGVGGSHVFTLASAFSPNLAIGGRIYVAGITGTAADILNDLSHTITNVAAAVITVSTVTTGLTAVGGLAYFYPQPTEALDFSAEFDVPVRFDVDQFDAVIVQKQAFGELLLELPSVPLVEIRLT